MKRLGLLFKLAAIWALIVLLMIPLSIIEATVSERQYTAKSVQDEIARSAYGAQVLSRPFLAVPYIKRVEVEEYDQDTKKAGASGTGSQRANSTCTATVDGQW